MFVKVGKKARKEVYCSTITTSGYRKVSSGISSLCARVSPPHRERRKFSHSSLSRTDAELIQIEEGEEAEGIEEEFTFTLLLERALFFPLLFRSFYFTSFKAKMCRESSGKRKLSWYNHSLLTGQRRHQKLFPPPSFPLSPCYEFVTFCVFLVLAYSIFLYSARHFSCVTTKDISALKKKLKDDSFEE